VAYPTYNNLNSNSDSQPTTDQLKSQAALCIIHVYTTFKATVVPRVQETISLIRMASKHKSQKTQVNYQ